MNIAARDSGLAQSKLLINATVFPSDEYLPLASPLLNASFLPYEHFSAMLVVSLPRPTSRGTWVRKGMHHPHTRLEQHQADRKACVRALGRNGGPPEGEEGERTVG